MVVTCVGLFSEEGIIQRLITGAGAEETARLEELAKEGMTAEEQLSVEDTEEVACHVCERSE